MERVALMQILDDDDDDVEFWYQRKRERDVLVGKDELALCRLILTQHNDNTCALINTIACASEGVCDEQEVHVRPLLYAEEIVNMYSPLDFKSHFRLSRNTVDILIGVLTDSGYVVGENGQGGNQPINLEKSTYITLWYLANQESMRGISDRFNVAKSTVSKIVKKMTTHIAQISSNYIKWPTVQEMPQVAADFKARAGFPGVIGAIDGSHIPIEAPVQHQEEYNNRKMTHSMNLQATCDSKRRFINCFAGFPGSAHDARVLSNSGLFNEIEETPLVFFPNDSYHILGDSAYPLTKWMMVPFKDRGNATALQTRYNKKHSQTRIIVECAFALLKGRFRRLRLVAAKLEMIPNIIIAACVLHNLCIENNDNGDEMVTMEELDLGGEGVGRNDNVNTNLAKMKRDYIASIL